jgi:hypothetical protein
MAMQMAGELVTAFRTMLGDAVAVLPGIVAAIVVLVLGYIVAAIVGWAVREVLERAALNKRVRDVCKSEVLSHANLAGITGLVIKWYVFLIFLGTSVELVNLGVLTGFLQTVVDWLPHLIVAVILMLLALILAEYTTVKVRATKIRGAKAFGQVLYAAIVVLVGIVALNQIGIDVSLLENLILAVVGSAAVGLALAMGISLGLGLKDDARKFVREIKK